MPQDVSQHAAPPHDGTPCATSEVTNNASATSDLVNASRSTVHPLRLALGRLQSWWSESVDAWNDALDAESGPPRLWSSQNPLALVGLPPPEWTMHSVGHKGRRQLSTLLAAHRVPVLIDVYCDA